MNRVPVLMLLLGGPFLLVACPDAAREEAGRAQEIAAEQLSAVQAEAETLVEQSPERSAPTGVHPADLDNLRAVLRPIDTPLPARDALEGLVDDPAAVLTTLMDDEDFLVRLNATRLLGHFGEVPGVTERLMTQARDTTRSPAERTAAVEGIVWLPTAWRAANVAELAPFLSDPEPTIGTAVVYALRDTPEGREAMANALDGGGLHPAVEHRLRNSTTEGDAP